MAQGVSKISCIESPFAREYIRILGKRYRNLDKDPFDWLQHWTGLMNILKRWILPLDRILNVGAGNSRVSGQMYKDGFKNITNIDVSNSVILSMQDKYADKKDMTWEWTDVRHKTTRNSSSL